MKSIAIVETCPKQFVFNGMVLTMSHFLQTLLGVVRSSVPPAASERPSRILG